MELSFNAPHWGHSTEVTAAVAPGGAEKLFTYGCPEIEDG